MAAIGIPPTNSRQIENLGLVKNAIRSCYGDFLDANNVHQAWPTSPYAHEVAGDEQDIRKYLRNERRTSRLKDQTQPYLSSCAPSCTTIQYKSLTRRLIESQGYDIVANVGDKFSDLEGGFADRTFKMPNPMYFLPYRVERASGGSLGLPADRDCRPSPLTGALARPGR